MKSRAAVTTWLAICAGMVLLMILAGGITRVSRAGLSITTWDPIVGALPPLSADAWRDAFERYRSSPEGMLVNRGIAFDDFRRLYLVEWGHRLLARVTGLVCSSRRSSGSSRGASSDFGVRARSSRSWRSASRKA